MFKYVPTSSALPSLSPSAFHTKYRTRIEVPSMKPEMKNKGVIFSSVEHSDKEFCVLRISIYHLRTNSVALSPRANYTD
jgi:hypothetical protein